MTAIELRPTPTSQTTAGRLRRALLTHRRSLVVLLPLLAISGVAQAINFTRYPMRIDDEGTYAAQAYAVLHYGTLSHYTYWYDHPPLGWLQLAGYAQLTDAFGRYSSAISAAREAMLVTQLVSCVLLWVLCRRLLLARWSSALAVLLFSLSPLAIQFHRTVYLDNIATPWLLAAFALALTPQKRLSAFVGSAVCFAVAVLTKETSLLLLPAVAVLLWRGTRDSGSRRYALTLAGVAFTLAVGGYALYAMIKGELLPGAGHTSLVQGVRFQLFGRAASGSVFTPDTLGYQHLHEWLQLDPVLPVLAVLATAVGLFMRRIRPLAIGFAVLLLVILKPGYLPVPYVIACLPLAAVLVAAVADVAVRWRPARWKTRAATSRMHRRVAPLSPIVAVVSIAALVACAVEWGPKLRGEFQSDPDRPIATSEAWIEHNVPTTDRLAVDDAYWVDLVRHGYPRDNVVWYYKMDTDPAVEKLSPNGWRDYDYLVLTQSVRSDPQGLATLQAAISSSVAVAQFGTGPTAVVIRRVIPSGVDQLPALRAADAAARLSAGTDLLANPGLTVAGDARAQLAGGRLDLRASTLLASLAALGPVTLDTVHSDAAETAASMPARSITVSGATVARVHAVERSMPVARQAMSVTRSVGGAVRIVWPLAPIPSGTSY